MVVCLLALVGFVGGGRSELCWFVERWCDAGVGCLSWLWGVCLVVVVLLLLLLLLGLLCGRCWGVVAVVIVDVVILCLIIDC